MTNAVTKLRGRRVLFISYNGMLEGLGQSQVIPYLRELSRAEGVVFTLLSYEKANAWTSEGARRCEKLKSNLKQDNIEWHWLRYHQKPSLPATVYDVAAGVRYASRLVRRNRIEMIHARAHIPATIALALKKRFNLKMIFDVRGLMAEEYLDAGHWREGSLPVRLTKAIERRALRASDGVVTLTEAIWKVIRDWDGLRGREVAHEVIPCCADLEKFKFDIAARGAKRAELGLRDHFVLVYSGSIGGWYLMDEMAAFFAVLLKHQTNAHFLWLTPGAPELVERAMNKHHVAVERYTVRAVAPAEVASHLAAADAGIAFYKPGFSKLATSPVKVTEYLACGLPVIINAGVGDSDALVAREGAGALVREFNEAEYARAAAQVIAMSHEEAATHTRCREIAERLFDVHKVGRQRYARLYEKVLQGS